MYGTTHAHLVHMCWPLLWGLRQMGRSFATFGTYALVGSLRWIMRVLNSQGSSSASATHPVPVMQTEHVQQFKVCYSRTQKFFTVPLDPQ